MTGRLVSDEDKVKDPRWCYRRCGIRSILHDDPLYAHPIDIDVSTIDGDYNEVVEAIMRARQFYKGSGTPTFYTTNQVLVEMLLSKDSFGRRRWNSPQELASALMVSNIVEVEVMDSEDKLLGIIVNLSDYVIGADSGGNISMFDDFDIEATTSTST